MEKLVYLLVAPPGAGVVGLGTGSALGTLAGSVATDLRARGARRIQINIVDPELGPPFGVESDDGADQILAGISMWVDTSEGSKVAAALPPSADETARWHGYLVCESEPLPNRDRPAGPDGRVPGFAQLVALSRPDHMNWGEWRRAWQGGHTSVALNTQSSYRYVQNVIFRPLTAGAPAYSAVVEECFPIEAAGDLHVFFDAVGDDAKLARHMTAMSESCDRFMDGVAPVAWTAEYMFA